MTIADDTSITHSGVKGMKWGVRRARPAKEQAVRDKRKQLSNNRRIISSKDLDATIERIQKEKKLKELVANDLSPGKKVAGMIISDTGQKVARTVLAGASLYAIKTVLDKKMKGSSSYIVPKPKR